MGIINYKMGHCLIVLIMYLTYNILPLELFFVLTADFASIELQRFTHFIIYSLPVVGFWSIYVCTF